MWQFVTLCFEKFYSWYGVNNNQQLASKVSGLYLKHEPAEQWEAVTNSAESKKKWKEEGGIYFIDAS